MKMYFFFVSRKLYLFHPGKNTTRNISRYNTYIVRKVVRPKTALQILSFVNNVFWLVFQNETFKSFFLFLMDISKRKHIFFFCDFILYNYEY